jgi:hypothetical protein
MLEETSMGEAAIGWQRLGARGGLLRQTWRGLAQR